MKDTKFQIGQSGNPAGRQKGKPLKITELRKAIEAKADDILQAVIIAAVGGDMSACKMLLDKIVPNLKPQALAVNLPVCETLSLQGTEIIKATLMGKLPPDVGAMLINALSNQSKLLEMQELSLRLDRLEKHLTHEQALEMLA
jgi:hypothetical protein